MTAPAADGVTSAVGFRPTTRVLLQDRYGPPDLLRLERLARPEPAAGKVLLAVAAAGVNPADVLTASGEAGIVRLACGVRRPRQPRRGSYVAGTVAAVGPGVTDLTVGDEVFGWGVGTFDHVTVPADRLVRSSVPTSTGNRSSGSPPTGSDSPRTVRTAARRPPDPAPACHSWESARKNRSEGSSSG